HRHRERTAERGTEHAVGREEAGLVDRLREASADDGDGNDQRNEDRESSRDERRAMRQADRAPQGREDLVEAHRADDRPDEAEQIDYVEDESAAPAGTNRAGD